MKLKIELLYNPAITLLGICPKYTKIDLKRYMHPNVYSSIIYKSQIMETDQLPINYKWIKKMWCVYIHTHTHTHTHTEEYYSAIKKNEILLFAMTWMELENIMLSEKSQS